MKVKNRITSTLLALLLSLSMVITYLPASMIAYATDEADNEVITNDLESDEEAATEVGETDITNDANESSDGEEAEADLASTEDSEDALVDETAKEEVPTKGVTKVTKTGTVLAFTSDVHNGGKNASSNEAANRLEIWINKVIEKYGGIDAMAFGGDMGSAYLSGNSFWTYSKNAMDKVPSDITQVHTTGNHEMYNGSFNSTTNTVKNNYKVGEIGAEGDNYVIYCLGSTSDSQTYTNTTAVDNDQVEKLTSFLEDEDGSRIIFIITHFPLHYTSSRHTNNAGAVIDALNTAADSGKTIVYLWGHNHTDSDPYYDHIYDKGTNLQYSSSNSREINFYYGAAGCMSDNEYGTGSAFVQGKGLVVKIEKTRSTDLNLKFDYLTADGNTYVEDESVTEATASVKSVTNYVQTDELEAGKEYIIAGEADSDGNVLMLSNESVGSRQLNGVSATVSNNTITISDDDVLGKVLFTCEADSSSTLGGLQLQSGGEYLFSNSNDGLQMHALDAGRSWYYKAYDGDTDKHILWLIKSTSADGWTTAGNTYKYYLDYSSGTYFTDQHVENANTIQGTSGLPKIYLYTEASEGDTYTLSYDANGGTGTMDAQTSKTTYTIKANSFTKEGFEFTKWNTKADGTGTDYEPGASITLTEDTTLYAQWTKATTVDKTVYVLTNSLTVGEKYLIVNTNAETSANGAHAIGMNSSAVADDTVTVNAGSALTDNTVYIDSDDVDTTTVWTVGGSSTSPTFAQGSSYLYPSSSGVSISTTLRAWTAPGSSSTNHYLRYASGSSWSSTNYYLNYNNGWTMTSSSSSSTYPVYFYEETTIKVSVTPGITVEPESANVGIGDTKTLAATTQNVEGAPTITWSSNNTGVATVDQNGQVTGVAAGTATITASMTYEGETFTDTCEVTVKQVNTLTYDYIGEAAAGTSYVIVSNGYALVNNNGAVAAVPATVNGNTVTLLDDEYAEANMLWTVGEDGSLKNGNYYVRRDSGNNKDLLLSTDSPSSNAGYMCFTYDGDYITVVSTSSQGSGTVFYIFYDSGWKSSSTQPEVKTQLYGQTVAVTNITLPATATVDVGGTTTLTATVLPENATNKTVTWSSDNTNVATVDSSTGVVTGVAEGTATITATTVDGGHTAQCVVTVSTVHVESVSITPSSASVYINGTTQLTAEFTPENASNKNVSWSSENPEIATVDSAGKVTGVAEGEATIRVTTEDGNKTASCTVTVTKPKTYVIVIDNYALSTDTTTDQVSNNNGAYIYTGLAGVAYTSGDTAADNIRWIIEETNGGYYIKSLDGRYLNATYTSATNPSASNPTKGVLKLDNTPDVWTLDSGVTLESWEINGSKLKSTNADKSMTYEESSSSSGGSAINLFTVRSTGETSHIEEAVDPVTATGITVSPTEKTILVGENAQLTATVTPETATGTVEWTSNNTSAVTVDSTGKVTGVGVGTAVITATIDEVSATATINVNPVPVESVTLDKNTAKVMEGKTLQLNATVLPENATDKTVTWTSSNSAIASVDQTGKVTGEAVGGPVTITATAGSKSATCAVTVEEYVAPTGYVILIDGYALSNVHAADNVELVNSTNYHYKGLNGVEYTEAVANNPPDSILWTITETTGGYYIQDSEGNYLNAVYTATTNPTGCNADLKVDNVQDVWQLEGTLEDWQIDGSTLKSTNADKSMTYEESVPIFTIRSTGETSTIEDPAHPITTETIYVETDALTVGKKYIVAAANSDTSVYALNNSSGSVVAKELTVTPASGTDAAYIALTDEDTGVVWNYTNSSSNYYFINNSQYLRYDRNDDYILKTTTSSSSATSTTLDGQYLKMSSRYVARDGNSFNANRSSTSGASNFRIFMEKKVIAGPGISLDKSTMTVPLGETGTLTATPKNAEGATVTWSSSDESVATINNGTVTGVSVGTATITATMTYEGETYSATCVVTVKQVNTLIYDYVSEAVAGKSYVIVSNGYALVNNNGAVAAVPATVDGNTVTLLDDEYAEADMLWTVGEDGSLSNNGVYVRRASGSDETALTLNSSTATSYTNWSYSGEQITVYSTNASSDYYMYYSSGWKTSRSLNGTTKLYGEQTTAQHTVTFNTEDGILIDTVTVIDGTTWADVTKPEAPAKEGYTFEGWTNAPETVTVDVAVTASYTINKYTVTFNTEGGEKISDVQVDYNTAWAEVTKPAAPEKTGYTFASWTGAPETVTADVTVTASYTINQYTVTFNTEGGEKISDVQVDYNTAWAEVTKPAAPEKTGYTFAGWTNTPDNVTASVIVTASYTANTYTVKFNKNDSDATGEMADQTFTYDVSQALTANGFEKSGYSFSGWATSASGEVVYANNASVKNLTAIANGEVTLYAVWANEAYYLAGTMTSWGINEAYVFTPNGNGEYVLRTTLTEGAQIKAIRALNGAIANWYPDGDNNNYVVDAAHSGSVTVYFRTTYNPDWSAFGGYFFIEKDHSLEIEVLPEGKGSAVAKNPSGVEVTTAPKEMEITIDATPANAFYEFDKIELQKKDSSDPAQKVTGTSFNMPDYDVIVKVYFKEKAHDWEAPTYTWADDYTSVTAKCVCKNDPTHTETEEAVATSVVTKAATCTETGIRTWTSAEFTNTAFTAQTETEVIAIDPLAHDWDEPTYTWAMDYSKATATRVCKNDQTHVDSETVDTTSEETKQPTCEAKGETTYTATFTNTAFATQTETVENVNALGHKYKLTGWTWEEDYSSATAKLTCENDQSHVQNVTATITSSITTQPTCTEPGIKTYTATARLGDNVYTDHKDVAVDKLGHDYEFVGFTWTGSDSAGYTAAVANYTCKNDNSHTTTAPANVTSKPNPATCEEAGATVYTAEVVTADSPDGASHKDTKSVPIPATDHSWGTPEWTWTGNVDDGFTAVSAKFTCGNDASHTVTVNAEKIDVVTVDPKPEESGSITYTVTVTGPDGEEYSASQVKTLPPAGYTYFDPEYTWTGNDNDGYSVSAICRCKEDSAHNITEIVDAAYAVLTPATCETSGAGRYTATFTNSAFTPQTKDVTIAALEHSYGAPQYTWANDNSTVTASKVCANDQNHVISETANVTSTVTKEATCEENGARTYTATFTNSAFTTQTKTVAIDALGHDWRFVNFTWTGNDNLGYTRAVANYTCRRDGTHKDTAEARITTSSTDATCTEEGTVKYTAVVTEETSLDHAEHSASKTVYGTVLGHDYELTGWTWTGNDKDGYTAATATFTCKNDASHVQTVDAVPTVTSTEATCDKDGKTVYTANVTFEDGVYTDKKEVVIPATGHDWKFVKFEWTGNDEDGYTAAVASYECRKNNAHKETVAAALTSSGTEPTCTEPGSVVYAASVDEDASLDGASHSSRKTVDVSALGHDWNEPVYKWTADNNSVTATHTCKRDAAHEESETVETTSEVTKPATCEAKGETTYTATFTNSAFAKQTKIVEDVDALGHDYGEPVWTWAEDNNTATAKFTCKNDATHVQTAEATVTSETIPATHETAGKTVYTATATFEGETYTGTKEETLESVPEFETHSLILSGQIGVNFFMNLPYIEGVDYSKSYMEFTVNGVTKRADFKENFKNASGYYGFTCYVNSIQMAETITAEFHYGNGKTVSDTYSVDEYVGVFEANKDKVSDQDMIAVVENMADYGHYVQPFLSAVNDWVIGTDYAEMSRHFAESYDYNAIKSAVADYAIVRDNNDPDIEKINYQLSLDSETEVYVLFKKASGYTGDISFTVDGKAAEPKMENDGRYRIEISGISAHLLGNTYTVVATTANGSATAKVSAMSYVKTMLDNYTDARYLDAAASLYKYFEAADTYKQHH